VGYLTTEVFFRPDEVLRTRFSLPAGLYNGAQRLLSRSGSGCVFVPIRSMQFMAVIDGEEIVFVDSQAYAVEGGVGGRIITTAWIPAPVAERISLSDPVACERVDYLADMDTTQRRLVGEFGKALALMLERSRDGAVPPAGARILPLRRKRP
jgi:hypothetical protein